MSHKFFHWSIGLIILIFVVSAYNLHVEGAPLPSEVQTTATPISQATFAPQSTATAPQSLIVVTPSATPTSLPVDTVTPTYSVPTLTLREATNCRTGPGQSYEIIVTYQINKTLEIVGRYDPGNFWLVNSTESPTGTCWLWGEYVDVVGSYWIVASVTPPPTAILNPPHAPTLQDYKYFCDSINNTLSFHVIWKDRADNETGYRIFRDGRQAAELPSDSTTFAETISMPVSQSAEYYVQAYNAIGSANMSVIQLTCE